MSNNYDDEDEDDYKALVVDDKEDVCLVIEAHLCQNGFKSHNIDKAFNAQTALMLLNSNQYFFIFLDVRLPDMDGTTLIDEIRKTSSKNKDAVLMMSSGENLDDIVALVFDIISVLIFARASHDSFTCIIAHIRMNPT